MANPTSIYNSAERFIEVVLPSPNGGTSWKVINIIIRFQGSKPKRVELFGPGVAEGTFCCPPGIGIVDVAHAPFPQLVNGTFQLRTYYKATSGCGNPPSSGAISTQTPDPVDGLMPVPLLMGADHIVWGYNFKVGTGEYLNIVIVLEEGAGGGGSEPG